MFLLFGVSLYVAPDTGEESIVESELGLCVDPGTGEVSICETGLELFLLVLVNLYVIAGTEEDLACMDIVEECRRDEIFGPFAVNSDINCRRLDYQSPTVTRGSSALAKEEVGHLLFNLIHG